MAIHYTSEGGYYYDGDHRTNPGYMAARQRRQTDAKIALAARERPGRYHDRLRASAARLALRRREEAAQAKLRGDSAAAEAWQTLLDVCQHRRHSPHTHTDFRAMGAAKRGGRTAAAAKALHDSRQAPAAGAAPRANRIGRLAAAGRAKRSTPTIVPLGDYDALTRVQEANRRLREWSLGQQAAVLESAWKFVERGSNSDWNKRSTFQRGIKVQSYATCTLDTVTLRLDGEVHTIRAPRGWRWDVDANGLRLRSCSDKRIDYHPTASDLLGAPQELARKARENWATRQAARRAAKADAAAVKRAEAVGVTVCLADSIRAGNCRAGSESWARNHGLDPARHYTPAELLALANGQTRQVALACTAALRRAIRELDTGVCVLAEHQV